MNTRNLLALSGAAGIAGGVLRIAASAPLPLTALELEALYEAIDILLLFALMGVYLARAQKLGFLGFAGFAVGVAALSFIGGPDADPFGFSTYEQGAAVLEVGLAGLSIAWLRAREHPFAPPLCWFASLIAAGVLRLLPPPLPDYGLMAAGLLFGAGFVLAGLDLVRRRA